MCIRDRFVTGDAELDAKFVKEATAAGFVNLKGHRTVGGMRAVSYTHLDVYKRQYMGFWDLMEPVNQL